MIPAAVANAVWWAASAPAAVAFDAALADPARAQEKILGRFLNLNASTAYGSKYRFHEISTPEQFARRVPPVTYDELQPWIERIRRGESEVLTTESVRRLVPTGGSTSARKLIPYTATLQAELNRAIGPWIFDLYRQHPSIMSGPAYWSITPAGQTIGSAADDSAIPVGFDGDADYLGGWRKRLVTAAMAVPSELAKVQSIEAWRYATLLLLLRRRDLALMSIWHPSFLDLLLSSLRQDWHRLLADIASGGCQVADELPTALRHIATNASPGLGRSRELKRIGPGEIGKVWTKLRVISCWADANASAAAEALQRQIPTIALQPKGLLATEGFVSIPYRGRHPLAIRSHYLEFEDDAGRFRTAADLQKGATYRVLLTTAGGLCRYRLNDVVKVDGFVDRTPSIRFVGRSGVISDLRGEKLTEAFVNGVLDALFTAARMTRPEFAMLAPNLHDGTCRYILLTNAPSQQLTPATLDTLLAQNPQYAYCRRLGQLSSPRIISVRTDWYAAYTSRLLENGQRLGDIKPTALSPLDGWMNVLAVQGS